MNREAYEDLLNRLHEITGVPRKALEQTPTLVIGALEQAIHERDRARDAIGRAVLSSASP